MTITTKFSVTEEVFVRRVTWDRCEVFRSRIDRVLVSATRGHTLVRYALIGLPGELFEERNVYHNMGDFCRDNGPDWPVRHYRGEGE